MLYVQLNILRFVQRETYEKTYTPVTTTEKRTNINVYEYENTRPGLFEHDQKRDPSMDAWVD